MGVQPERGSANNWRKSSYSADQGNCVEMATQPSTVLVRDSSDLDSRVLEMTMTQWELFLARTKNG